MLKFLKVCRISRLHLKNLKLQHENETLIFKFKLRTKNGVLFNFV